MSDEGKGLNEFEVEFRKLSAEARELGVSAVIILATDDPIARHQVISPFWTAGRIQATGMLQHTLWQFEKNE